MGAKFANFICTRRGLSRRYRVFPCNLFARSGKLGLRQGRRVKSEPRFLPERAFI
ncbi:hypothetical protein SAMN06295998_104208 [Primorskyibacter flagellatus]|uniref:Uncharacterized protein n=1 Tax=Primorskyibacter flagellatus TaxID=1387277 RepID=A0A1W2BNR1_9RHOB|nr:hypothetical protein SAMN06295998_104208 [Primorskyibacter flagellatus]